MLTQVKIVTCNDCKNMQQIEDAINQALVELYNDATIGRIEIHEHGAVITYSTSNMQFIRSRLENFDKQDEIGNMGELKRIKQVRLLVESSSVELQRQINQTIIGLYQKYPSIDDVDVQIAGKDYQLAARIQYSIEVHIHPKKKKQEKSEEEVGEEVNDE